jgi:hypothetical protein
MHIVFSGFLPRFLKLFEKEILLTILLVSYSVFLVLIGDNTFAIPYIHIVWFLESFFIPTFLIFFFKDIFNWLSWETLIVQIGFFASLITLFLIFNPSLNLYIRNSVIVDSLDSISTGNWDFRGFTVAESSSFGYGLIQGLILAICLFSIKKHFAFFFPIVFLFISILFNSRIGIAPVVFSIILIIINNQISFKSIALIFTTVLVGFMFFQYSSFSQNNETSLTWGFSVFNDVLNVIEGEENNAGYTVLFSEMLFFPSDLISLIFGSGQKVFGSNIRESDVGYIIQIFRGGLIYLLIMVTFLFLLFKRNLEMNTYKLLPILFFLTIIVANIKGDAFFNSSGFFRLYTFFYVYSLYAKKGIISNNFLLQK